MQNPDKQIEVEILRQYLELGLPEPSRKQLKKVVKEIVEQNKEVSKS